jgi:hypothetical protein
MALGKGPPTESRASYTFPSAGAPRPLTVQCRPGRAWARAAADRWPGFDDDLHDLRAASYGMDGQAGPRSATRCPPDGSDPRPTAKSVRALPARHGTHRVSLSPDALAGVVLAGSSFASPSFLLLDGGYAGGRLARAAPQRGGGCSRRGRWPSAAGRWRCWSHDRAPVAGADWVPSRSPAGLDRGQAVSAGGGLDSSDDCCGLTRSGGRPALRSACGAAWASGFAACVVVVAGCARYARRAELSLGARRDGPRGGRPGRRVGRCSSAPRRLRTRRWPAWLPPLHAHDRGRQRGRSPFPYWPLRTVSCSASSPARWRRRSASALVATRLRTRAAVVPGAAPSSRLTLLASCSWRRACTPACRRSRPRCSARGCRAAPVAPGGAIGRARRGRCLPGAGLLSGLQRLLVVGGPRRRRDRHRLSGVPAARY